MKDIKMPEFMRKAGNTKAHSIWGEMVIFTILYVISVFVEAMAMVPGLLVYILSRPGVSSWLSRMGSSGGISSLGNSDTDVDIYSALIQSQPEWLMIYTLFAEILLILLYIGYCRLIEKRSCTTMGFIRKGMVSMYVRGLLMSVVLMGGVFLICAISGAVHFEGISSKVVPGYILFYFLGYMIQGMAEEIICRGYLLVSLSRNHSVKYSILLSSGIFMAMHMSNDHVTFLAFCNIFLCGLLFGLLFVEKGNIWLVAALHSGWNFLQSNIFGGSVSGMEQQNAVLATTFEKGKSLINGGSFGVEGGIAVTVVLAAGIYMTYRRMEKKGMLIENDQEQMVMSDALNEQKEEPDIHDDVEKKEKDSPLPVNMDTLNRIEIEKREAGITTASTIKKEAYPKETVFDADYFKTDD